MSKQRKQFPASSVGPGDLAKVAPQIKKILRVSIELPIAPVRDDVYATRHLNVVLSGPQARAFRQLFDGLCQTHAELSGGRYVKTPADCLRWIAEKLTAGE